MMKDWIIKAIDKGLMNVLSTDIEDQNIDFNTPAINNEYIPEISLDDLNGMFNENKESIFNIKYDTRNAISLILDDDSEISLYQYEEDMNPVFIKISNDELLKGSNDILIYIPDNHYIPDEQKQWQKESMQMQNYQYLINDMKYGKKQKDVAKNNYDGFRTCERIIETAKINDTVIPAITYCDSIKMNGHQGYLPAVGQLKLLSAYIDLINYILNKLNSPMIELKKYTWLSSTEHSGDVVWTLSFGCISGEWKQSKYRVLPFFKYKN